VFLYEHRLPHLLSPRHYHGEAQHRIELDRLFLPAWHPVAITADLPGPGDFLTLELLGRPLLLRNCDGELHAFLNVCAHRHCLLTHAARGHDPRLRCQYHGWEYTREGRPARIPEAGCFRPWDREGARLQQFRVATAGQLVFVSLAEEGTSLGDHLGDVGAACAASFAPPYRLVWSERIDYAANWKIVIENSLESYHIPSLHRKTFGTLPAEDNCEHVLGERATTFRTHIRQPLVTLLQGWFVSRLGRGATNVYTHHHVHPNLTFATMDVHRLVQVILPTSPTTARHHLWLYAIAGAGPLTWLLSRVMGRIVRSVARRVLLEDAGIFADVQRGVEASPHPGVIGTREERVHAFQRWVLREIEERPATR
jgi:phenylpropionate dioxygenase-like ring-hydroxylating dioxygenase large terminal subunit